MVNYIEVKCMIKIIVVEDEKETQLTIKNLLRKMDFLKDEEIKVEYFTKYTNALKEVILDKEERKIYILDIELDSKVSGIDIARFIRDNDWDSEIIFITNHDKMFETAYRSVYEVFDFIEKFHDLEQKLKKDLKAIFKKNFDNKMFKFESRNLNLQIFYRSITYLYRDTEERKLIINTDKTSYAIYMNVQDSLKYLDNRFLMVHRACVVNMDCVEEFNWSKGYFVLNTGEKVHLLSRKYKKEVEEYYARNS